MKILSIRAHLSQSCGRLISNFRGRAPSGHHSRVPSSRAMRIYWQSFSPKIKDMGKGSLMKEFTLHLLARRKPLSAKASAGAKVKTMAFRDLNLSSTAQETLSSSKAIAIVLFQFQRRAAVRRRRSMPFTAVKTVTVVPSSSSLLSQRSLKSPWKWPDTLSLPLRD